MPPRFAYWTILIDNAPTAFRAREREELATTLHQLRRTNKDVVMKWFARGRLWDSREEEQAFWRIRSETPRGDKKGREGKGRAARSAPRGDDWRPGGKHADPRARFRKRKRG